MAPLESATAPDEDFSTYALYALNLMSTACVFTAKGNNKIVALNWACVGAILIITIT